jgi:hypothetical protein
MDFSSDVLIDFGLNLAGYLVAALLIYMIVKRQPVGNRKSVKKTSAAQPQAPASAITASPAKKIPASIEPEFVSLSDTRKADTAADRRPSGEIAAGNAGGAVSGEWRRQNRRAIYAEARRLLARGDSPNDLMTKLPVTESELDMLTAAGKA